jgi:hypothetical protein
MLKKFEVNLADRRGDRKAHQILEAESMGEAIVKAEQLHNGLMVNKCVELVEFVYRVGMVYSQGTTHMYNTIKAYSEADAAAIARRRNPSHDVVSIQKIG